jgi:hypothetical protein
LRLVRLLPAIRVASVIGGGILTALSIVITVPELIGRLGNPLTTDPTSEPIPVDPSVPSGAIDPATLLAMVTGVVPRMRAVRLCETPELRRTKICSCSSGRLWRQDREAVVSEK